MTVVGPNTSVNEYACHGVVAGADIGRDGIGMEQRVHIEAQ